MAGSFFMYIVCPIQAQECPTRKSRTALPYRVIFCALPVNPGDPTSGASMSSVHFLTGSAATTCYDDTRIQRVRSDADI
jgi:hypothetical protein